MGQKKDPEEIRKERERHLLRKALEVKYRQRFSIAREGKTALARRDFKTMVMKYSEYLKILADTYEVPSIYDLKPSHFDNDKNVTELLVISQIYWEFAKLFDQSTRSKDKLMLSLRQFVLFTVNMSYQTLNSEIVRKELKRRKFKNADAIKKSLESIYRETSSCFVAHFLLLPAQELSVLRKFRNEVLLEHSLGANTVKLYYAYSPKVIHWLRGPGVFKVILKLFIFVVLRPLLRMLVHFIHFLFNLKS